MVREGPTGPELLVFDHLDFADAGTQVPAGGMELGEEPPDAALREVREEAGIEVQYLALLGRSDRPHPETGEPRDTVFVLCRTSAVDEAWDHSVNGCGEDAALRFRCWFAPLPLPFPLADEQGAFLHLIG